jgi:dTDP-4-dehydrorhamnose 3,5-epimerase
MKVTPLSLPDVVVLEPEVFRDERGSLFESYHARRFEDALGAPVAFVQENHSSSVRHVLRGLHYQVERPQAKLVRVVRGEVYDVAVDLRRRSLTFGQWVGITLNAADHQALWLPAGYAHGFLVLSEHAEVVYKMSEYRIPALERCIAWDDPQLDIAWPLTQAPVLSARDTQGVRFAEADTL